MKNTCCVLVFALFFALVQAQNPIPLHPDLSITEFLVPEPEGSRLAYDPVGEAIYYGVVPGDIYRVNVPASGPATSTKVFSAADHGITFLQGMSFHDSLLIVSGNVWMDSLTVGRVMKAKLEANGQRTWSLLAETEPYEMAANHADHGFTATLVDTSGQYVLVTSGSRTHNGEVRSNNGRYPGLREVPLTNHLFQLPLNGQNILLPNDSAALQSSGYIAASGLRNTYSMAWDGEGRLFGVDNSGERDDPEELNWLRYGEHYGFPWTMGANSNPLQVPGYDKDQDPLVNPLSGGYQQGFFEDVPGFPAPPNLIFREPVLNFGPDADKFRDPVTGAVRDASDEAIALRSFSAHRSPVGLVIDADSLLGGDFSGDAFVASFMPGGDSTGMSPDVPWGTPGPFVDPARDLLHMELIYNSAADRFEMSCTRIAEGFYLPTDVLQVGNFLYVLEYYNGPNPGRIWQIEFPTVPASAPQGDVTFNALRYFPNPAQDLFSLQWPQALPHAVRVQITSVNGTLIYQQSLSAGQQSLDIDTHKWAAGMYLLGVSGEQGEFSGKFLISRD